MVPVRFYVYLGILVVVSIFLLYERGHLITEGKNEQIALDKIAVAKHDAQVAAQIAKDRKDSQDVVSELKSELETLAMQRVPIAPHIKLCQFAHSDTGRPASGPTSGAQSPELAHPDEHPGVLAGDSGPDVGGALQDIKDAGRILATYRQLTVEWALKQAK